LRTELRRNPDRPAFGTDLRLRGRRLVLRVQNVEAGIEECVLVRDLSDRALPLGTPDIVVFDDEGRESQALQVRAAEGQRANGAADLETLLVVDLGLVVVLAVVDASMHVTIVAVEAVVAGDPGISRRDQAGPLREHRPLEAIAVDTLAVVEVRRLLLAES